MKRMLAIGTIVAALAVPAVALAELIVQVSWPDFQSRVASLV